MMFHSSRWTKCFGCWDSVLAAKSKLELGQLSWPEGLPPLSEGLHTEAAHWTIYVCFRFLGSQLGG